MHNRATNQTHVEAIAHLHRPWISNHKKTLKRATLGGACGCFAVLCFVVVTASAQSATQKASADSSDKLGLIKSILTEQTKAWNDGDLNKFMETYWKSDKLTFSSGGKTTYGWQATLDNYKRNYAPPKQMGQLHFDGLEVFDIESNSALVLGRWHLKMDDNQRRDGNFSLVVKKLESGWKIIHDHSSSLDPEN